MKTFDWLWFRFNDILFYLDSEEPLIVQWLVDDIRKEVHYYNNGVFSDDEIWFIILCKFDQWFDEFMWLEQLEINKRNDKA
jgi:hypothetical protein